MSSQTESPATKLLLSRVAELLRLQDCDRAALIAQRIFAEHRAITEAEVGTLTQDERVSLHAALLIIGRWLLEMQNELPGVDVPHALKLLEDSIGACDDVALRPLIASLVPPSAHVH